MDVTGLSESTVSLYLGAEYKQTITKPSQTSRIIPASERIEHELGEDYVERHRKEVLEDYIETLRRG